MAAERGQSANARKYSRPRLARGTKIKSESAPGTQPWNRSARPAKRPGLEWTKQQEAQQVRDLGSFRFPCLKRHWPDKKRKLGGTTAEHERGPCQRAITIHEGLPVDTYTSIKAKYGFEIPAVYRTMEQDGFFELKPAGEDFDPRNDSYLWVPEAESMRPPEILAYETPSYQLPGFVPFAFTGGGEPWCWWPEQDPEAVVSSRGNSAKSAAEACSIPRDATSWWRVTSRFPD